MGRPRYEFTEPHRCSDAELAGELMRSERAVRRLQAAQGAIVAEMESRGPQGCYGYPSVEALQVDLLRIDKAEAKRRAARARACHRIHSIAGVREPVLPATAEAFADGAVGPAHVDRVHEAISRVPDQVPVPERDGYEKVLADLAREATPYTVAKAAARVVALVDPDGARPTDAQLAEPDRELHWSWRGQGLALSGQLDREAGQRLQRLLSPLAAPRPAADGTRDDRPVERRNGDALAELLEHAERTVDLPAEAGSAPTVVVTMTLDQLLATQPHSDGHAPPHSRGFHGGAGRVIVLDRAADPGCAASSAEAAGAEGSAMLDGMAITAEEARRIACDAEIIPAVLGASGEVLDLGRSARTASRAQRRALNLRDRGCVFPNCPRPSHWCQAHHIRPWADGGTTDIANMILVCGQHHRLLHHSDWNVRIGDDGHPDGDHPSGSTPDGSLNATTPTTRFEPRQTTAPEPATGTCGSGGPAG